jgi:nitroimidazol reductase NimA-like FMN-containing flavoprotein (pyridoxamine 5'-phosphate oxidase superfamily)
MVGQGGRITELDTEECYRRIARLEVGRVGFTGPTGPEIIPVNYRVDGTSVVFRTSPYGVLSAIPSESVAFEVDEIDRVGKRGWSVLLVGRARAVDDHDEFVALRMAGRPEPWVEGARQLYVRIMPHRVTGRAIG